ncbi:MAG: hypothetical protein EHM44_09110 [Ignavibacteriales bacterium]|nr:MAG: hypothetical protein EHM44_09110 [Ignavibacteriales bacterium]
MAQHIIYLTVINQNSISISPDYIDAREGDTMVFIALKGAVKVSFAACQDLFKESLNEISSTIYQGCKWETPELKLGSNLVYPFQYSVIYIAMPVSDSKGQSKKIVGIVG